MRCLVDYELLRLCIHLLNVIQRFVGSDWGTDFILRHWIHQVCFRTYTEARQFLQRQFLEVLRIAMCL